MNKNKFNSINKEFEDKSKPENSRIYLLRQNRMNNNTTSQQLSHDIYNQKISDTDLFTLINSKNLNISFNS